MQPIIEVTTGRLCGTIEAGVAVFRGIPYAAAPLGRRRFMPPAPAERWDGVRDACGFGAIAPQHDPPGGLADLFRSAAPQSEDCLTLNVWSPDLASSGLPVLVWIPGGAFMCGSGREPYYDGSTFAADGVVCVTINYRLGALGFLAVGYEGRGAFGLLDQIAALRWVQENIASFGGDPDRVTVAGQSAGAMSIGLMLAAPSAHGLFRRAILQSGACHNGLSPESAQRVAREFCARVGLEARDLEALQVVPVNRIIAIQQAILNDVVTSGDVERFGFEPVATRMPWQPVVGTALVPSPPLEAVNRGDAKALDLLVGHTREEARLFFGLEPHPMTGDELQAAFQMTFGPRANEAFGTYKAGRGRETAADVLAAAETDRLFRIPAIRLADSQSAHNPNTFFYRFSWQSPAFGGRIGAAHTLDLPFTWGNLDTQLSKQLTGANPPVELAKRMHGAWVSFITSGHPDHGALPPWPSYNSASRPVMDFGDEVAVVLNPDTVETALWDRAL